MATGTKLFSLIAFVALCLTFFVHAEKTKDDKERQNSKYGTTGIRISEKSGIPTVNTSGLNPTNKKILRILTKFSDF